MKRVLILAVVALLVFSLPAFADTEATGRGNYTTPIPIITRILNENDYVYHNHDVEMPLVPRLVVGVKLDAPNLVRFTRNLTLGIEVGKDLYNDPFMDSGYAAGDDKGYFVFAKMTYSGTWLNFSK